jgi:uncharacterized protein GlcG (DUF336 family)
MHPATPASTRPSARKPRAADSAQTPAGGWLQIRTAWYQQPEATPGSAASGGRYTPQAGGIPIRRNGMVIGAAGASGEVDEEILQQALRVRWQPSRSGG